LEQAWPCRATALARTTLVRPIAIEYAEVVIRASACIALIITIVMATPALAAPAASSPLGDALDLLEGVHDADGTPYPAIVRTLGLTFDFVPLPTIFYGAYQRRAKRVLLNSRLLDEDTTVLAAVIVHELQHARDYEQMALGAFGASCAELEVRAFEAQSRTWRAFWPTELPTSTRVEQDLTRVSLLYEGTGVDGLRQMVTGASFYQRECASRAAA
jgi:hypothetical protein